MNKSMVTLTPDQQDAVDFAVERLLAGEKLSTIGGYAGTGKTTIMGEIVNAIREKRNGCSFAFACYTKKTDAKRLKWGNSVRPL
ncbi:MAG: hypothetical protein EOM12_09010 [Verrucomicrobiae bacterium]|nr:hypothetical protein [Verrucomicrobiae bacterium]